MGGSSYLFVEASEFTRAVKEYFGSDEVYADFQAELASDPEKGRVIPGAAPLRKVRWGDNRRRVGKRGGIRVIYLHVPEFTVLLLLDVYGKGEAEDLSSEEKRAVKALAGQFASMLRERQRRGQL